LAEAAAAVDVAEPTPAPDTASSGWAARVSQALQRSREQLRNAIRTAWMEGLDEAALKELETVLIRADLGPALAQELLKDMQSRLPAGATVEAALDALQELAVERLSQAEGELRRADQGPTVTLVVGVNGAGKTTTIGKLAARASSEGQSVLVAAGDTYRAGAIDQLRIWAERVGAEFVSQQEGADPGAVVYTACDAARARGIDHVLADTAGRLHTAHGLMDELKKVHRVAGKVIDGAPHNVLLVLDGTVGQNGLVQAREFTSAVQVTHIAVTKLDGTAKGGAVLAVARDLGLPIAYVGVGEGVEDLRPFQARVFAKALFGGDV
jgi:fused signal recognition particle receptor